MHASEPASSQPIGPPTQLLAQSESPDLSDAILAFLEQDDPPTRNVPSGALTVSTYKRQIDRRALRYKTKQERRQISREALQRLLTQPELAPPPRLHLAELLTELYERGTPSAGRRFGGDPRGTAAPWSWGDSSASTSSRSSGWMPRSSARSPAASIRRWRLRTRAMLATAP